MSINITKTDLGTELGIYPALENWYYQIFPWDFWVNQVYREDDTVSCGGYTRWWPVTKWLELGVYIGSANFNKCKIYLNSYRGYGFGTYEQEVHISSGYAGTRLFYPLMLESPLGGSAVVPPTGEKAGHILFVAQVATEDVLTGYDGASSQSAIVGWTVANDTVLKFEWESASVKYYVDGVLKVTHNAPFVPQTAMAYNLEVRQDNQVGAYAAEGIMRVRDFTVS